MYRRHLEGEVEEAEVAEGVSILWFDLRCDTFILIILSHCASCRSWRVHS